MPALSSAATRQQPAGPAAVPMLRLTGLTKRYGPRTVVHDLSVDVAAGELLCVLGPSGCGKTTMLRMIGGFEPADAGRILIDGTDVTGLGPERRPTGMVFQNYALWPHLTAAANIGYGLRVRKLPRSEIRRQVAAMLTLVGLEGKGGRRPGQLSGGEQQRVALARALVLQPKLLLMDEPLSNLDAQLRLRVREELAGIQRQTGVTMLFVTHDQDEALSIADRIAVMRDGRLEQLDTGAELYRRPASAFVAGFIGRINWLTGLARGHRVVTGQGAWLPVAAALPASPGTGQHQVAIRPEALQIRPWQDGPGLDGDTAGGEPGGWARARVTRRVSHGHFDEVVVTAAVGELRGYIDPALALSAEVAVRAAEVLLYRDGRLVSGDAGDDPPPLCPPQPPGPAR